MTSALQETKPKELNLKQVKFCELYASDVEFFGNGTQAYIEAYDIDITKSKGVYAAARSSAHNLLTNPNILTKINELLESATLNDEFVDKQIAFLITQNADFGAKMSAIKEYNQLKKRINSQPPAVQNFWAVILEGFGLPHARQDRIGEAEISEKSA